MVHILRIVTNEAINRINSINITKTNDKFHWRIHLFSCLLLPSFCLLRFAYLSSTSKADILYIWFLCVCGSENNDSNEKKNTGSIVANNNTFNLIAYKLRINEFLIQPNDHNIFLVLIQMVHNWCCARIQEIVNVLLWLTTAIGKGWWITGGIVIPVIK